MKLFIGLGNPGESYSDTRHNVGFNIVVRIFERFGTSPWRPKFNSKISSCVLNDRKAIIAAPQTFMNLSGIAVKEITDFYKLKSQDITVFHDELNLSFGKIKTKIGGGHGGHNGLKSINQYIGSDYQRVRVGIGHPGDRDKVSSYVLSKFDSGEKEFASTLFEACSEATPLIEDMRLPEYSDYVYELMAKSQKISADYVP